MPRNLTPQARDALREVERAMSLRDSEIHEFEASIADARAHVISQADDRILQAVARALATPGVSKRQLMTAARAQNWDRWKALEARVQTYLAPAVVALGDGLIAAEIPSTAVWPGQVPSSPERRALRLRTLRFPHKHVRAQDPGNDVVIYDTRDQSIVWANVPTATQGLGPYAEQIRAAVEAWVARNPREEQ